MVVEFKGRHIALQPAWLRITYNPKVRNYPRVGDEVHFEGHKVLLDGQYIVQTVREYEPPSHLDTEGRDIRITFCGINREFNGQGVLQAIKASSGIKNAKVDMSISMEQVLQLKGMLDTTIQNLIGGFEERTWLRVKQLEVRRTSDTLSVVSCVYVVEEKICKK